MTKTTTIVKSAETHQDVLNSFEQELGRIESERRRLTDQIAQHQAELATLTERAHTRAEQETAAQEAINTARSVYSEVQLRSELLTEGALAKAAQTDLVALEKQLRDAQERQIKLLSRTQQDADADNRKRFRRQEEIDRAHQALQHLAERQQLAEGLRQKAIFDKAEATLKSHLNTLAAMRDQRDQQQAILVSMDTEIENHTHRAYQDLAAYPDQQHAFQSALPYSDQLTRILEAKLNLIDVVLTEGTGVALPYEVKRKMNMTFLDLPQLLSIDHPGWWPALAKQGAEPDLLLERKAQINRILAIHRELKAEAKA